MSALCCEPYWFEILRDSFSDSPRFYVSGKVNQGVSVALEKNSLGALMLPLLVWLLYLIVDPSRVVL